MFEIKEKRMLDEKLTELKMNLENNYKDLAHDALKELYALLKLLYENGGIKEKTYKKYAAIADGYSRDMEDYGHFIQSDASIFTK